MKFSTDVHYKLSFKRELHNSRSITSHPSFKGGRMIPAFVKLLQLYSVQISK